MTITDKIRKLIIDKNLTSTKFADEIDVPRPSISHILSGRNKPSLEIVQKIIKKYPDLGLEWVIEDDDFSTQNNTQNAVNQSNTPPRRIGYLNREMNERKIPEQNTVHSNLNGSGIRNGVNFNGMSISDGTNKTIKKITVFFTDGTFIDINSTF